MRTTPINNGRKAAGEDSLPEALSRLGRPDPARPSYLCGRHLSTARPSLAVTLSLEQKVKLRPVQFLKAGEGQTPQPPHSEHLCGGATAPPSASEAGTGHRALGP